jgi:hypothetical protein
MQGSQSRREWNCDSSPAIVCAGRDEFQAIRRDGNLGKEKLCWLNRSAVPEKNPR